MNIKFALPLAAALAFSSTLALAHGNEEHAAARKYDASKVEPTDFGQEGNPKQVTRTIKVEMADTMRFTPADITVKRGETIKFVVHNEGKLLHEMVLGTTQAIEEHAALMKKFPEMEHADANMAHVKPGASGEMVWQFSKAGEFRFACLQPGHFEGGMVGKVTVTVTVEPMTEGEVRKVDKEAGKLTLRHGRIENLDMPAMTMVFRVADPSMLETLKEGDKIRFAADRMNGALTVIRWEPSP